ncbi:hypothetical protein ATERTT37_002021 [Aspergillus terreus]
MELHSILLVPVFLFSLACARNPVVDLGYARYRGQTLSSGVNQWLGIRYAAPPVGPLRFAAPQDPRPMEGIQYASKGGGYNENSQANYNGTGIIQASHMDIVVVTFNYRVGPYGFLSGEEVLKGGSLNNGLKDHIKVLQWVQKHIRKFGGDPERVVIGGASAGGASVTLLLSAYGGRDDHLFHGAAAESQSFAGMLTLDESQFLYNNLVIRTGCASDTDTLACLRRLDTASLQLQNIQTPLPRAQQAPLYLYGPTIDEDLVPDYTYRLFHEGKFIKVPVIFGDASDEGTVFVPKNSSSLGEADTFIQNQFPEIELRHFAKINKWYFTDDQLVPYPNAGHYWKATSNAYGEMRYICPGIDMSSIYAKAGVASWNFHYAVLDPQSEASGEGTTHTVERFAIWGPHYVPEKAPESYFTSNAPIVPVMQGYWTSFIKSLDPNLYRYPGSPEWKTWGNGDGYSRLFIRTGETNFGAKVLSTAREIYNSTSGDTSSNRNYESVAHQLEKFAVDLLTADTFSGKEKALCALAQECRDLAIQIQDLLQKSRPKDPKSKRQVAWSTLKSLKYKEERLELQERLGNCRDQLALQLNEKYCSEIRRSLDALVSRSQDDSLRVVRLQQQVEELRRILEKTHSRDSQNYIQQLLQLSEDSFHALVSQRLIERLAFDDMYGRFDTIAKAHYDTFKWIFYGDTNSDGSTDNADDIARSVMEYSYDERQDAYRDSARESFLSWLSSDHGIFHICGKLGSGKSTLMKFLCEDTHTKKVLEQWAGDRTLVMASFFFWKPGSKLQKSMDGLLRALLYETLKSLPALVPTILPEQWNAISSTPWQMHTKLELRPETIREAFGRLIDSHTEDLAICFFIDGLDEYEQTRQEDHLSMIERLDSWCGGTAKNIKICVSSREYNVFMNRLPSQRRIRMQNLTDKDIRLYIQDKIDFAESPEQAQYLVETIASKADGIFLWVALVVTRARELHENSVDFEGIMDEVDRVPRGLEELFKHILESLEPYERKRAYQTFAMMRRLQREDIHFPLLAYAFIDNYEKHSQAVDAPLPASSREPKISGFKYAR